jgi:hypothetical protein
MAGRSSSVRQPLLLFALAGSAAFAPGQDHRKPLPPTPNRVVDAGHEHHLLTERPLPSQVFTWVKAAVAKLAAADATPVDDHGVAADHDAHPAHAAEVDHDKSTPRRPTGAGRWVIAVVVDPEADVDPHAVLGVERGDVLVLAAPGLCVRPEELALLEHAQREAKVALCLVMARQTATSPAQQADSPAALALRRRLALAEREASRTKQSGNQAQAQLQAEAIVNASEPLRFAAKQGLFRTAVALLPERGATPTLLAPWFDHPLPEETFAEQAQARAQRSPAGAKAAPTAGPALPYPEPPGEGRRIPRD